MSSYSKILENIDWELITLILALIATGLVALFSATYFSQTSIFWKQLVWIAVGLLAMLIGFILDYRFLMRLAWPLYVLVVILLVVVLGIGREISGARRWLSLGPLGI